MVRVNSESHGATWRLGERLGEIAGPGTFVALGGDLGAGKTVFAKGVGAGLGVSTVVSSPTFVLVALHESGRLPLWHVDAYRLGDADEVEGLGLEQAHDGIVVMEWAVRFPDALPVDRLDVRLIDVVDEPGHRVVEIEARGARHHALEEALGDG
ncbi:MAG: tRNA (adenosine(37)-N6)-threonylcarbamoyltransferase complex ATPase subunit type 1 TsaE [Myxococcota bacterium]